MPPFLLNVHHMLSIHKMKIVLFPTISSNEAFKDVLYRVLVSNSKRTQQKLWLA